MSTILLQPAMPPRLPGVLLMSLGLHAALMLGLRGPAAPSNPPLASLYAELRGAQSRAKQAIPPPSPDPSVPMATVARDSALRPAI